MKLRFGIGALLLLVPSLLLAQGTVLTSGNTSIGVQASGALGYGGVGIAYSGVGDAITPGCLCEGWGISGNGIAGYYGNDNGISNVTIGASVITPTSITTTASLTSLPDLTITQTYAPSTVTGLFQDTVTITNTGASTITDARYSRALDWDVPPTTFDELISILGTGTTADLLFSNDNGFAPPNPLVNPSALDSACPENADFTRCGPADHGSFFTFGFGNLAPGASVTFDAYFGAFASQADALAGLGGVGAEIFDLGENSRTIDGTPATFTFGFSGVGGVPVVPPSVPEPSSIALAFSGAVAAFGRKFLRRS